MAEYLPPVVAQLTADIGDFLTKIAEAQAAMDSLEGKTVGIDVAESFTAVDTAIGDATNEVQNLANSFDAADTAVGDVADEVQNVKEKLLTIEDLRPWDSINSSAAITQLRLLDAEIAKIKSDATIDLVINSDEALTDLGTVQEKLLTMEDLQPWGSVNDSVFQAQMASIDATLAQTKANAVATNAELVLAESGGEGGGGGAAAGVGGAGGPLAHYAWPQPLFAQHVGTDQSMTSLGVGADVKVTTERGPTNEPRLA